jgi:hypothetical protein
VFLGECGRLEPPVPRILCEIHRYRNEAYHQNKIRKETIRLVALLLFDLACELLVTLRPSGFTFEGGDDWSTFERRFGKHVQELITHEGVEHIRDILRLGLSLELSDFRRSLADHLESRLDNLLKDLAFIKENSRGSEFDQVKTWIKDSARFSEATREYKAIVTDFNMEQFARLRVEIDRLRHVQNKLLLFSSFADVEGKFEPMEECVSELASELDSAIQLAVDAELEK